MFKIRYGLFETNSSSTHSIVIGEKTNWNQTSMRETISPIYDDFHWGPDDFFGEFSRNFAYLCTFIANHTNNNDRDFYVHILESAIKQVTGMTLVTENLLDVDAYEQGSIDHESSTLGAKLLNMGVDATARFLFSSDSILSIGNDNSEGTDVQVQIGEGISSHGIDRTKPINNPWYHIEGLGITIQETDAGDIYESVNLLTYRNGNTQVTVFPDGTKIRKWADGAVPVADFPESIDLKITNRCSMGCSFCHEDSTPEGKQPSKNEILVEISRYNQGIEIALGGGDIFEVDGLKDILLFAKERGVIVNITVHEQQYRDHFDEIKEFIEMNLVKGIGVSIQPRRKAKLAISYGNGVAHIILGIHSKRDISRAAAAFNKILFLGFKTVGRGINHKNIEEDYLEIIKKLQKTHIVAFDNLAVEQLNLKEEVSEDVWERNFMGDDGQFTLFVDLVEKKIAVSSSHPRLDDTFDSNEQRLEFIKNIVDGLVF